MAALLVRLKLTLLRNSLRRSVWRMVGLVLGGLYGLSIVGLVLFGMFALRTFGTVQLTTDVTIVAFSALTVGWLLLSLLVFGVDETVDPARFALLPVNARRLQPGLFLAGLVGIPGLATVIVALGLVLAWSRGVASLVAAIIAVPLGVAACFLLSRAATAAFARALRSRRFRDVAAVLMVFVGVGFGLFANIFGNLSGSNPAELLAVLTNAAEVLSWTPFGWPWAIPADVAAGAWGLAAVRLVLSLALVAGLWFAWGHFLDKQLVSPLDGGGEGGRVRSGNRIDRLFPNTPAGAVAARTLRYWRRDPRYLSAAAGVLVGPVILIVSQLASPYSSQYVMMLAPALVALLIGPSLAQDISYDGNAVWQHVVSGMSGRDDRIGRIWSMSLVLVPVMAILLVAVLIITGRWDLAPAAAAAAIALTLIGLGLGAWIGGIWQWPAPPPGSSPFTKGSGGGIESALGFGVTTGLTFVGALPTAALIVVSFWIPWVVWLAVLVALVSGVVMLLVGIRKGGELLDRRWPEVLSAVTARA